MQIGAASPARQRHLFASWAQHLDEVRETQQLRFSVFAGELGAALETSLAGHDIDHFDDYCDHLLVRDSTTSEVVGCYRVLTPSQARRLGHSYCDLEFDLAPLRELRPAMAELGRSCVHSDYRVGGVIQLLWNALADFMLRNHLQTMMGCASIPLHTSYSISTIWDELRERYLAKPAYRVKPRIALPQDSAPRLQNETNAQAPALVKGYLRLGARVLGPPAWDQRFKTADLPMLMHVADLPARYLRGGVG